LTLPLHFSELGINQIRKAKMKFNGTSVLSIFFLLFFSVLYGQQYLVLNEFMAGNNNVIIDTTDNNFEDWIEIYNAGMTTASLAGYFLTDDASLPGQWPFPSMMISPGEFTLVWADNDSGDVGLHTNFRLDRDGEFLGLYSVVGKDTIAVDTLTFGPQIDHDSYGRFPDGSLDWQSLSTPTPAGPNSIQAPPDSSVIIFDDTVVHEYELHFYITDWADSLAYYYEHGEEYIPARLTYQNMVLDSIGVRYKGNSSYMISRRTPKKPFKFKFDKYKKGQTFFGLEVLNFSNCVKDPTFMREKIGYDIARKYVPAPRAAYANIHIEGELIGFYVQIEQVDELFLARHFTNDDDNLYKASDQGTNLAYLGTAASDYQAGLELKTNENANDWSGLVAMLDKLNNTPAENFEETMEQYLDLDLCCRLLVLNMVLSNFDSYTGSGRNFYLYDDSLSGQFRMIPWDLNEAFGAYTNNWNVITADIVNVPNLAQRPLNRRILENESLKKIYLSYINEMILGVASYDSVYAMTVRIKSLIEDFVQADNNKLYSYANFINNVESNVTVEVGMAIPGILSFSRQRNENLRSQLAEYLDTSVTSGNSKAISYRLYQNYPNPFNHSTTISFSLPQEGLVRLQVFNLLGEQVATLVDEKRPAGYYSVVFDAPHLSSGLYLCKLILSDFVSVRKLVLIK
jgi:hypothetical protein